MCIVNRCCRILPAALVFIATSLVSIPAGSAEEEALVLTITGDQIGRIESLNDDISPLGIVYSYYALLPDETRAELDSIRLALSDRIPDYRVANRTSDTAELNAVVEDLAAYWASIRSIHAQEFTSEVSQILETAYGRLYPVLAGN